MCLGSAVAALSLQLSSQASITGQWDFKSGNLAATIGSDLSWADGTTSSATVFGTTTALGIPNIGGTNTAVMAFPNLLTAGDPYGGVQCFVGASPNGGGNNINQYTVIEDIFFPNASDLKPRALFVTDNGGEFMLTAGDQLSLLGAISGGSFTPNTWHRIAVTVDTTSTGGFALYIDGTSVATASAISGGVDGKYSIGSELFLFDDANTNSQAGYVASIQFQDVPVSAGLISALGGPVASGILTGPPPNPYVASFSPTSDNRFPTLSTVPPAPLVSIVLQDGTATVNASSVHLSFNGTVVTPVVNYSAPATTITYQVPGFLGSLSTNTVSLTYQDSGAHNLGANWSFIVGPYTLLSSNAVLANHAVNTTGFLYRVAQAPATALLAGNLLQARQQLDGTLLNTNGVPFANEATLTGTGAQPNGTYFIDQYEGGNGTISFTGDGSSFYQLTNLSTGVAISSTTFPGIPGTNGSLINFSDESLAYVKLAAGTYVFGVDVGVGRVDASGPDDNGYILTCGPNPRDYFAPVIGSFSRHASNFGDHQNANTFTFVAPVAGVYPFRLLHWDSGAAAKNGGFANNIAAALYYIDPATGNPILVNDPSGSISAYRVSTVAREPYIAEVYPAPNGSGFLPTVPIKVILSDDDLVVNPASIKMTYNGVSVTPSSITKSGTLTTVSYSPNAIRTTTNNVVTLAYADNSGTPKTNSSTWSFANSVGGATTPQVTGQWDFNNCDLSATVGYDLQYFDGPTGLTSKDTVFGTCSSFGIPTINGVDAHVMYVPAQPNGTPNKNKYGYTMFPNIAPNGGGQRVNQYTIIWDMYYTNGVIPFFNCQDPTNNTTDGSLFLQNGTMGQGGGGYNMRQIITPGWHRIAFAVDLAQGLITKWVDGNKQADWTGGNNTLDNNRRSLLPQVDLFADGDGDDDTGLTYVKSIQIRNGKLSDAQMIALGAPDGHGIPINLNPSYVTGQWDFAYSNLLNSAGLDMQYFDGTNGLTAGDTQFGTCSSFGIPSINGSNATVMFVPAQPNGTPNKNQYGYTMFPNIAPNGGGQRINQYTIIWDMYYTAETVIPFFDCQDPTNNTTDGSLFLQNGAMGQGGGGYVMKQNVTTGWHRIAFAVDLSQGVVTKWVDGLKQQDWTGGNNVLDNARRSLLPQVDLFADGDGDDDTGNIYVRSIQISSVKLSDAVMASLGAPNGKPIPAAPAASSVTGQWDFNYSNLWATVGNDMQYFDGPTGLTAGDTQFGTCSTFGIPPINGSNATVMLVPAQPNGTPNKNQYGYTIFPNIAPNGGGQRVNQYTIIWDMYYTSGVIPFFNCQDPTNNTTDGSLFLQNGTMGQGGGGYNMVSNISPGWHRIAFAVDLSQGLITKWVDGLKEADWTGGNNTLDNARRSLLPQVDLFADGDGDDDTGTVYVKSIQISSGKASDAYMRALGGPSGSGIPIVTSIPTTPTPISIVNNGNGTITVTWQPGWALESTTSLTPPVVWNKCLGGAVGNTLTIPATGKSLFFRSHQY